MDTPLTLSMEGLTISMGETNAREPVHCFIRRGRARRPRTFVEADHFGMSFHDLLSNKENVDPFGILVNQGIISKSPLPSWYPRVPLQDITNVVSSQVGKIDDAKKKDEIKEDYGCKSRLSGSTCGMYSHAYQRLDGPMIVNPVPLSASKRKPSLRKEFR